MDSPSILVVDDQEIIRSFFSEILTDLGYSCSTAEDGKAAILEIKKEGGFDIIFCDLIMPRLDGGAVLDYVVEHHPESKVIICSVQDDESIIISMLKKGATAYLVKPVRPIDISNILESAFQEEPT